VLAVVVVMAEIFNILCEVAKEEDVVLANFTRDFDLISKLARISTKVGLPQNG